MHDGAGAGELRRALTTKPVSTPAWEMKNVKDYTDTAAGLRLEMVLGSDLVVAGHAARWRECPQEAPPQSTQP